MRQDRTQQPDGDKKGFSAFVEGLDAAQVCSVNLESRVSGQEGAYRQTCHLMFSLL